MKNKHAWIIGICILVAGMMIGVGQSDSEDNLDQLGLMDDGASIGVSLVDTDTQMLFEEDVASYLGVTEEAMAMLMEKGALPSIKIGDDVYYPKESLDKWVEENVGKSF
ncbi:helix-turn-helix domain-containing protein [Listeria weihenstephanensis]|uniref:Helix-turn-helix domain-containing protein n=1 Tax=Listeria weihenstephanensis TaxID=1006155 RepID=A0A841Z8U5_9LIST|nr:helix-turn-helix domain-containing protein [Listeria weihenstephanensis]MBC1501725.1 helix-turn-helix domain-containing protein [Listeria weihenstephanensis]